jgi:hypothetical protein
VLHREDTYKREIQTIKRKVKPFGYLYRNREERQLREKSSHLVE